ncbi:MAG: ATP-dependent zinc metalloprotease FtsH [Ruminococcaceae bacterium]|nr:ATP-dependent zinc metalloprotease FtsH [Oscillospiraceae bacterium]
MKKRSIASYILTVVAIFAVIWGMWAMMPKAKNPKYDQIISYFEDNKVKEYTLDFNNGKLAITLREKDKELGSDKITYTVPSITLFLEEVDPYIEKYNEGKDLNDRIRVDHKPATPTPWWFSFLPTLLLIGVFVVFYVVVFKKMQDGGMGGGRISSFGKAKIASDKNSRQTTFKDVAGADEEKAELAEIVDFLKSPKKFNELGARIPKGVLLMGPPGTGKTLLARAVAGEAGVPFFSISGSDFVELYVGVGASRVRDLFEQAKKHSPSIIFIDEIDAVGRHRGAGLGGGHDEREQTLNQLLVEMDGFGVNTGVIVIAATNRRDILDPALLRPGRFDREIVVGYPDVNGREEILKVHSRGKPLSPDVDLKVIARSTTGFTGADLENLMNEAALLAARNERKAITEADIEEATIKVVAGTEKKSRKTTEKDNRITAYHEAGHAVCMYFLKTQDPVHHISIIPRGMAAGFTMSLPEQDKTHMSKTEMRETIVGLLGGRASEQLTQDDICTGASNDMERATAIAKAMVTKYGFSEKLGNMVYGHDEDGEVFLGRNISQSRGYSETIAFEIDKEVRSIIDEAYKNAIDILSENKEKLDLIAEYLLEHEKMDQSEFISLMEKGFVEIKEEPEALAQEQDTAQEQETLQEQPEEKKDNE